MTGPRPRRVSDADALKTLAHPLRVALLQHLLAMGPSTASECAEAVGSTASNCSWHLRRLAEAGFVERAETTDGRERPWRSTEVGFEIEMFDDDPAVRTQQEALLTLQLNDENRLVGRFLDRRHEIAPEWLLASTMHGYTVDVTPEELTRLLGAIDDLLRPYLVSVRHDAPEGSAPAHVGIRAFPR